MSDAVRIRRGTAEDIPVILRHRLGMMAEMGVGDPESHAAYAKDFDPFLRKAMGDGTYLQWFAETGSGQVAAGGAVYIVPWPGSPRDRMQRRAFIVNVYTEPDHRRRGIARRLMQTMLAWCREQGYRQVRLHASDMGRPLYEAMGFYATRELRFDFDA